MATALEVVSLLEKTSVTKEALEVSLLTLQACPRLKIPYVSSADNFFVTCRPLGSEGW